MKISSYIALFPYIFFVFYQEIKTESALRIPYTAEYGQMPESIQYINAKEYLKIGSKKLKDENYIEAISNFKLGIQHLGNCYLSQDMTDDSENWILIAWIEEYRKKNLQRAAIILKTTLSDRIKAYEKYSKIKC